MIHILKHVAFRVWSTVFLSGLVSILILPWLQNLIRLEWMPVLIVTILLLVFGIVGRISNRYGSKRVAVHIAEAGTWERAGRTLEAENAYRQSIAVFDSFLFSPGVKKKQSALLMSQLARLYLARADKNQGSEAFVVSYLQSHPDDRDVAENWIRQIQSLSALPDAYQDLAFQIGDVQQENMTVQRLLGQLYLSGSRTDFPALQTYRRVLEQSNYRDNDMVKTLATIFLKEGRTDEWALKLYLQAHALGSRNPRLLDGIAACVQWLPDGLENKARFERARELTAGLTAQQLKAMTSGFNPPLRFPAEDRPVKRIPAVKNTLAALWRLVEILLGWIRALVKLFFSRVLSGAQWVKTSHKTRRILKWVMLSALAAGMAFLFVNTLGHLLSSKSDSQKRKMTDIVVTGPYTLQVAAFLKPEHAERYVAILKKQGLDAYWTEAVGKKKKWYQVRVSHFVDKKSAIAYGNTLKAKGLIEDFYVDNYSRP